MSTTRTAKLSVVLEYDSRTRLRSSGQDSLVSVLWSEKAVKMLLKQRTHGQLAAIHVCVPRFSNLRVPMFLSVAMSLLLAAMPGIVRASSGDKADGDKITALIEQLGDDAFVKREAASKKLAAVGEPALNDLRKTAASSDDPEIRYRCNELSRLITATAAEKELAKWEGMWQCGEQTLVVTRKLEQRGSGRQ